MTSPSPPSQNLANAGSLNGAISFAFKKMLAGTDDMLPAKVLSYSRTTNRARLQIMVPLVTTGSQVLQRAIVASVPVLQLGGGGFVVSFPIAAGNLGWIKACDRDISQFKSTYSNSSGPPTQRLHSFSDAMFIPDTMLQGVTIAGEDADNLVIQNLAGTVKVSWWSSFLKILAPRVGIGGTPNANAILDLQSTTKAFIPPRMTTSQRNAIPSPTEGMVIYNTTTHGLEVYTNAGWP
jgi:hypothetical protein